MSTAKPTRFDSLTDRMPGLGRDPAAVRKRIEAMEQVHRWRDWLKPDFLIAYASGDAKLSDTAVIADGAAMRSNNHWFALRYDCQVAGDGKSVAGLSFALGPEIPTAQWDMLGLTLDGEPGD